MQYFINIIYDLNILFKNMRNNKLVEKYDKKPDLIMEFLALFNQIDKHLDKILWLDMYLPYNEKLKRAITGNFTISWFIKLHQFQLRYFGEIRNQITHGIKLDGHTYVYPSPYAIAQLAKYADSIKSPPRCIDIFGKPVFTCKPNDKLETIIQIMQEKNYSHVPVYKNDIKLNKKEYIWVLTESNILGWMAKNMWKKNLSEVKIEDLDLSNEDDYIIFVRKKANIYEIDELFTIKKQNEQKIGAVLITENGKEDSPLLWIITSGDTALVDTYVIH